MITLSLGTRLSKEHFEKEVKGPIEKSIKHIQLEQRSSDELADVYLLPQQQLEKLFEQNELLDFRLLSNSNEVKPKRFEPNLLAWGIDDNGVNYALPYNNANEYPLFYNKSIFDKLGVQYPTDNMNWEDVIKLARKVTANVDGNRIYGFDPADFALIRMQLAALYLNSKTGQPNLLHHNWLKIAQTLKRIYSIDGNILDVKHLLRFNGYFVRHQSVAMGMICASCFAPNDLSFEWDIVSYPIYKDGPAWNANIPGPGLAISRNCTDLAASVEVVSYLVSDDHQSGNARNGIRPSIIDPRINAQFGMNNPLYYGKNIASFSVHSPAPPHKNKFERNWNGHHIVRSGLIEMITNNLDEESTLQSINQKLVGVSVSGTV